MKRDHILFQTSDAGTIRIWHQTIQEYFAACYIWDEVGLQFEQDRNQARPTRADRRKAQQTLDRYIADSRWHEILAILSGLISGRASERASALTDQTVVKFIDSIWRKDRLLGAMCLGNVERFNDERKIGTYLGRFKKDIIWWGIILPRMAPWLLLASLIAIVAIIPQRELGSLFDLLRNDLGLSGIAAQAIGAALAIMFGGIAVLIFFRLYATAVQKLENWTNERFIRPGISALRYIRSIRSGDAERALTDLRNRIANDFSVGETTRITIKTGLLAPVRSESELILMLKDPRTVSQAIVGIGTVGSERALNPLIDILNQAKLENLTSTGVIDSLVRIAKRQPVGSEIRRNVESQLRKALSDRNASYSKQLSAYRGLMELGVSNVEPPKKRSSRWILLVALFLLFTAILLVFVLRLS